MYCIINTHIVIKYVEKLAVGNATKCDIFHKEEYFVSLKVFLLFIYKVVVVVKMHSSCARYFQQNDTNIRHINIIKGISCLAMCPKGNGDNERLKVISYHIL